MTLFVELGKAGSGGISGINMPVEIGSAVVSEAITAPGTSKKCIPTDDTSVFTLTADANGYVKFGKGDERRVLSGARLSFAARKDELVVWREG